MVIELALLSVLGFYNTPNPRTQTHMPSLIIHNKLSENTFFEYMHKMRMCPTSVGRMNVVRYSQDFQVGFENEKWTASVGHISEHGVGKFDPLAESLNYVQIKYRWKP